MNIKELIEKRIKELYNNKASFCAKQGYSGKNLSSKINTVQNKLDFVEGFLLLLDLEIIIKEKE